MRPSFAISTSARQFRQLPSRSVPWTRLPYRTPRSRNLTPNTSHRSFSSTSLTMQSIFKAAVNVFSSTPATTVKPFDYPKAHRSDHIDVYKSKKEGEVKVHDPYQWLEEKSPETDKWVEEQVTFTQNYLSKFSDRDYLKAEISRTWDYAKFSAPSLKRDSRWYWYYNSGLKAQSILYRSKDDTLPTFDAETVGSGGDVFFDPNLLSDDGTAALSATAFSRDGKYFAYGVALSGSDFFTIYVRSTSSPFPPSESTSAAPDAPKPTHHTDRLSDEIRFVKFSSITWTHDSKGFFYQRYPERKEHGDATEDKAGTETLQDSNAMLYYHVVGTPQADDILVIKSDENPTWMWGVGISELDGRYLELQISRDTGKKNLLWFADLTTQSIGPDIKWDKLIDEWDAEYTVIANNETKQFLLTNKDAPKYKVVTVDLAHPAEQRAYEEFIAEDKDALLSDIQIINGDDWVAVYSRNVQDELYLLSPKGEKLQRVQKGFVGAISVSGNRDQEWFFATLSGFTNPGLVGRYTFGGKKEEKKEEREGWKLWRETVVKGLRPDEFRAEQVWYESKDGTKVPMFIVRHESTKLDGSAPAIQYGYGGFSIPINPFFSSSILTFLKIYGAILAVPNIRGGGEFGEEWHLAGTREKKINVFDDFIAATEYLVKNKYAAPGKVAINGGSNGGLLVAACANRAPQGTFGAAVAEVGVLDMLKFPKFTIGKAWTSDYGDPEDPNDFDFIYPYSPLHNVPTDRILPPTILLTADHDDRVVPLHSFKHAATLQHIAPHNPHPLLIRIDTKSGHGAGKSTQKRIDDAVDKWGFVAYVMDLKLKDEAKAKVSTDEVSNAQVPGAKDEL